MFPRELFGFKEKLLPKSVLAVIDFLPTNLPI